MTTGVGDVAGGSERRPTGLRPGRPARPARPGRTGRIVALAVAVAVVAALAALFLPRLAALDPLATGGDAPAAAADPVVPAVVVASASCVAPDPRDRVAVDVDGTRREVALESCGNRVGTALQVRLPEGGGPAVVLGTGRVTENATDATSPLATRLSVILALVAGLSGAALLVAVGRERRAHRAAGPPRRPAGPTARR